MMLVPRLSESMNNAAQIDATDTMMNGPIIIARFLAQSESNPTAIPPAKMPMSKQEVTRVSLKEEAFGLVER